MKWIKLALPILSRQFSFERTDSNPPGVRLWDRREPLNESLSMAGLSFQSEELSLQQVRAPPDWLPKTKGTQRGNSSIDSDRYSGEPRPSSSAVDSSPQHRRPRQSESVPKTVFRATTTYLKDLLTLQLPLDFVLQLKVIAILGADSVVLSYPKDTSGKGKISRISGCK